ncbi:MULTISPECIES: DUF4426 domain-containing protein [Marinobacter]|uniref:DUF4426 domain-containing protein n=1 Tax=Marinobacter profundi TaxID=2666256 RepID=A0A2G1UJP5_9GAMM|nr:MULTISPECIES: DUF4426 domain-containing protein [Marinobacter]MBD3656550.1 DUF4426 domain-containing protein [Marinobacter sp.]PHQ14649.1 hypothetical protein CLH61_12870 [Marinobacter profundi]
MTTLTRHLTTLTLLASLLALALAGGRAHASSVDFGEYQVHYSTFPSTYLTPEVAKQNNLQRSRAIGIVNIAIMRKTADGGLATVSGQVEGKVLNDIQQAKFLAFRRIQEGDAVYFISEFQYSSGELLTFQVTARPTGASRELPIRFAQTLFNEE